jgi:L-alanine-DL-glutamate epimerase-like enolase superfamily enzyme
MELIRQVELFRCPVKLKEPFIISLGKLEFADNLIVVIKTSGGITGFGECSPFLTIHGENSDTCHAIGKLIGKLLVGKNALDIEHCHSLMDGIVFGNTSVKSAFDIALHDIASQKAGLPLYRYLGGRNNKKLVTDYTISINAPSKMAEDAVKIVAAGFPVIKVKLGGSEDEDYLRMKLIRDAVGYNIPIRIDANQGWTVVVANRLLKKLADFNIQHCEEPVRRNEFMALPGIRNSSPIKIMADESCFDHSDAERLIGMKACDLINVKLGKSSGIFKAMKIARIAEKEKILLQAGGFLESRLGFTASAHLALSSDQFVFFDFDTPLMFREDPVTGGIEYQSNGVIKVPDSIGLGASVSESILNSLQGTVIN